MAEAQKTSMENTKDTDYTTVKDVNLDNDITGETSKTTLPVDTQAVKEVYSQAKEKATQAVSETYSQVTEKATETINEQKGTLAQGLSSLAENLRQMDENLRNSEAETPIVGFTAKYGDSLADQVQQVADYLERKDVRAMVSDVESYARRNPAIFIGGAFVAGLLLARFLKSSGQNVSSRQFSSTDTERASIGSGDFTTGTQTDFNTDTSTDFNTGTTGKNLTTDKI